MSWRLAKSLAVLRLEANIVAPGRDKTSDGTIGDAAHAGRASSHNPNEYDVVCGMDLTHDPPTFDTYSLFDFLVENPHPNLAYAISNGRIATRARGWVVRPYSGSSKHDHHIHLTVGWGSDEWPGRQPPYDDLDSWSLSLWAAGTQPPEEEEDMTPAEREMLQYAAMWSLEAKIDANIAKHLGKGDTVGAARIEASRSETIAHWRERWKVV